MRKMKNPYLLQYPEPQELGSFIEGLHTALRRGYLPLHYFGSPEDLLYALLFKGDEILAFCAPFPANKTLPSLANLFPAFGIFERLLYEEYGIKPEGHPWLKAVRNHLPGDSKHEDYEFFRSDSAELHEVGVGPVHAGVIEPGHFRFICKGEIVQHLEIQLGYQHRGVEKLLVQGDPLKQYPLAEAIAGDTAIGHGLAHALMLERMHDSEGATTKIRNIALELERIAMHLADLSALAADVAYIMGQNLFAALRTTVINSSLAICGSRFGKRWLRPGGVNYGISPTQADTLKKTLLGVKQQVIDSAEAMFGNLSVITRLMDTGVLQYEDAIALGTSGITAKASGVLVDCRMNFPIEEDSGFIPLIEAGGDVYSRAYLRYREIIQSLDFVMEDLDLLDVKAPLYTAPGRMIPNAISLAMVEGWRGRILHIAKSSENNTLSWYKVLDPSLVNWQGLALAMRETGISDFPICNKSFDLSYCGSDL